MIVEGISRCGKPAKPSAKNIVHDTVPVVIDVRNTQKLRVVGPHIVDEVWGRVVDSCVGHRHDHFRASLF